MVSLLMALMQHAIADIIAPAGRDATEEAALARIDLRKEAFPSKTTPSFVRQGLLAADPFGEAFINITAAADMYMAAPPPIHVQTSPQRNQPGGGGWGGVTETKSLVRSLQQQAEPQRDSFST